MAVPYVTVAPGTVPMIDPHASANERARRIVWTACLALVAFAPACRRREAQPANAPHEALPHAPPSADASAPSDARPDDGAPPQPRLSQWTRLRVMYAGMTGGSDWTVMPDGRALIVTLHGGLGGGPPANDEATVAPDTLARLNAILADPALARELADTHCGNNGRITDVTAQITIDTPGGEIDREVAYCLYADHPPPPIAALFETLRTVRPPAARRGR